MYIVSAILCARGSATILLNTISTIVIQQGTSLMTTTVSNFDGILSRVSISLNNGMYDLFA